MKTITVFYFSGTGNTQYVCGELVGELRALGLETDAVSIEKIENDHRDTLIETCDVLALAYPIYGLDIPDYISLPGSPFKQFADHEILEKIPSESQIQDSKDRF